MNTNTNSTYKDFKLVCDQMNRGGKVTYHGLPDDFVEPPPNPRNKRHRPSARLSCKKCGGCIKK